MRRNQWMTGVIGVLIIGLFLVGGAGMLAAAEIPPFFEVVEVEPPLPGWSYQRDLNNLGTVVGDGMGWATDDQTSSCNHAFSWADGVAFEIGDLLGDGCSNADGVNDLDLIVGAIHEPGGRFRLYFIDSEGNIATPDYYSGSLTPVKVNDAGQVVGHKRASGGGEWTAFLVDERGLVDLHPEGAFNSRVGGINNSGVVVGSVETERYVRRAFFWTDEDGHQFIGTGGDRLAATAINDRSQIVLSGRLEGDKHGRAYLFEDGELTDLGSFGSETNASDINNLGWIVGMSGLPVDSGVEHRSRAFVWVEGIMYDLNELVPVGTPWELSYPVAVNDRMQILIRGRNTETGLLGTVLLSPPVVESVIEELIVEVRELIEEGEIRYSRGRSLIAELQVALWFLEFRGGESIAAVRIELFIIKVERLVRNGELDPGIGDELLFTARAILDLLRP